MVATQRWARAVLTDWRIWGLTCFLLGWPAIGILANANFLLESATPLVYGYLFVLNAIVQDTPGSPLFWIGFALFCLSIATALVRTVDWIRIRRTASKQPERESITTD